MFDQMNLGREFFSRLMQQDEAIARQVAGADCPECGGPLHRADYDRKPRGGVIARAGEEFVRRFSLCCGREGCRKRATPPSLRFLGRRVYLGAVVLVVSIAAQALATAAAIKATTGVPARTAGRWLGWWRGPFLDSAVFVWLRARLVGVAAGDVPTSIVERLEGSVLEKVGTMLELLAPLTTGSVRDGSRFLRSAV
jgi:hypothetical protein